MKHTLETIADNLSTLNFADTATNHEDAREGSALAMAEYANQQKLGGFDDWVLPTRETLFDLYVIKDREDKWYWSSSPYVGDSYDAWVVHFYNGYVSNLSRYYGAYVRLVRASQLFDIGLAAVNKRFGVDALG